LLLRVVRFSTGAGFGALTVLRDKQKESPYCLTGHACRPSIRMRSCRQDARRREDAPRLKGIPVRDARHGDRAGAELRREGKPPPYKGEALELTLGEEGVVVELKARWLSAMLM